MIPLGLGAVIRKEFRQLRRDPRTLAFLVGIPAFLLLMFGYALNFDYRHISLAVCDEDMSPASRDLAGAFSRTEYFDLEARPGDQRDIDRLMGQGKVRAAVVIPRGFAADLAAGRTARVQVLLDGSNSMSASTAAGYVGAILQARSLKAVAEVLEARGLRRIEFPLEAEARVWFNPELRSAIFLVPGLMALILMVMVVVATAFSIVREKERGTMEQLRVSPVRAGELIIGKTVPYVLISLVSAHLVLLLGHVLFGVPMRGSYPLLLLTMTLFLVGGLGQGLLISTVTRTQQVAFLLAILSTMLPTFILSGFAFPIRNMPPIVQALTYAVPARFFLDALRAILLKGAGLPAFWDSLAVLAAFAVLTLGISTLRMRAAGEEGGRRSRRKGGAS